MKILVIGNSTRSIVCSAKRAGYTVFSLDNFCDVDMRLCADFSSPLEHATDSRIYELARTFRETDGVILGTGFERLKFKNVMGNRIEVSEEVNDKLKLAKKLQTMGIPHPETEELSKAGGRKFPLMIKPRCGSGGMRNITVNDDNGLAAIQSRPDAREFIAQEFVEGVPCSASLIGTGDDASVIALNEQLIGIPRSNQVAFCLLRERYAFCYTV